MSTAPAASPAGDPSSLSPSDVSHAGHGHAEHGHADHGHADHGHADHGHASHGHADHAHDFDGEPATALPADEPMTPTWVPVLGLALFVIAGVAFLAMSDAAPAQPASDAAPEQSAAAAPAATQTAPAGRDLPANRGANAGANGTNPGANPGGNAAGSAAAAAATRLSPDQLKNLRDMIDKERAKRGLDPLPAGGAAPSPAPSQ